MTDNSDAAVSFVDVCKTFDGEHLVVKNLNLDVSRGEFLTLLGPSGSGKTTSLMMLAGFEAMTSGDIRLGGRSLRNVPPYLRNIGMVFQNYALFPHMTVEENLAFPLEARGVPKSGIALKIRHALEMVRLADFAKRRPGQLSGGQQQRVAVARALVYEPALVLMDEPLGALDKQLREQMQLELKHIHQTVGVTVVYVTHDQSEALTMSDRIAVFSDGEIQQIATPQELYEEPENAFVAQFIGENNSLSGTVRHVNGTLCQVELDGGFDVEALAVNVGKVGSRTTLSIRPECVQVNPTDGSCKDRFDARVEERIYLGDHVRFRVAVCGNDSFVIKIPRALDTENLEVGRTCTIGWSSHDCRALDAT
ncbi:MAG: ABC transporter ATP-binding protein [Kiloniellales bacterium]|nr:ABC transporter ATP-binding protein [Kiloniellales bacterium]